MIAAETLQLIQDRLTEADPLSVIEQFAPRTLTEAFTWARCRPLWDEFKSQFTDQAIGIAATISQRAMKEHRLSFGDDGRVVQQTQRKEWRTPKPSLTFSMEIDGQPVHVEYTHAYFPVGSQDYFYFTNAAEPGKPHPLSGSGYLSHFCQNSSVSACGSQQAYAQLFAQAMMEGREKEFVAVFEGKAQEMMKPQRKTVDRPAHVEKSKPEIIGEHTAAVVAERVEPQQKTRQGELFA